MQKRNLAQKFKVAEALADPTDDKLNRATLAEELGSTLANFVGKESLVVGVYSSWGDGKTTFVNFVLNQVNKQYKAPETPLIIKFNPWQFSNHSDLAQQFLKQLATSLLVSDRGAEAKKIGEKLLAIVPLFNALKFIPEPFVQIGSYALTQSFKTVGTAAKAIGDGFSKDLETIKMDVSKALGELPYSIFVVIDDMDRLQDTEIKLMFQLIKSVCNFKNTIYLLPMDIEVVSTALSSSYQGNGRAFLEKIIQVPIHLPKITSSTLETLINTELESLFPERSIELKKQSSQEILRTGFYSNFKISVILKDSSTFYY
ncbi:P-loop NTPase fold protein [Bdellovibrio bacteriovorus]|uniref:KAP family P-loop NTPase fold protein n=1 Tax=Bdellovibrio bacteriovorus TaxID=959 RepID=UPI0035A5E6AF